MVCTGARRGYLRAPASPGGAEHARARGRDFAEFSSPPATLEVGLAIPDVSGLRGRCPRSESDGAELRLRIDGVPGARGTMAAAEEEEDLWEGAVKKEESGDEEGCSEPDWSCTEGADADWPYTEGADADWSCNEGTP